MVGRRRWWPQLLLGLIFASGGAAGLWLGLPAGPERLRAVLFAAAAGIVLAGARRWPGQVFAMEMVLLAAAVLVAPTANGTVSISAEIALGFVAYRCGWTATLTAYGGLYALGVAGAFQSLAEAWSANGYGLVLPLVLLGTLTATPVAVGRYLASQRAAVLVAKERAREAESRRAAENRAARLSERTAIARDLHDIVAHHISAIALRAGAARYAVQRTGNTDEAVLALGELGDTAGKVLDELRELLAVLRDPEAVEVGVAPVEPEQIIREAERRVREAGVTVRVTISAALATAPLVVRTTAARVVREALTNTLKHAGPGTIASVDVRGDAGWLLVEVVDSGPVRPRPPLPPSGHGLSGMRERVGLLGGTLTATATEGGGWRVTARLPTKEAT